MHKYRIIGWSGIYDCRGNDRDKLIKEASQRPGWFTLWEFWNNQWHKKESFYFTISM